MTTTQIIIFIIFGICICIGYFGAAYNIDYTKKGFSGLLYVILLTFIALLVTGVLAIQTQQVEELRQKLNGKCHEYERIDNVYKLKE